MVMMMIRHWFVWDVGRYSSSGVEWSGVLIARLLSCFLFFVFLPAYLVHVDMMG